MLTAEEWEALSLSIKVASVATLCSVPFGLLTAWILVRRQFFGKAVFEALVHLPLVLPPVATGFLLLLLFGGNGVVGRFFSDTFGLVFAFRWTGAALACAVMSFPLMVRAFQLALESVDRRLEQAAGTLGAPPPMVFLTITLPLLLPGLLTGMVLAFARAVGEFGATITFVSNIPGETRTLAAAISSFLHSPGGDAAAMRLTLISIALALAALLASEWLARRARRLVQGA